MRTLLCLLVSLILCQFAYAQCAGFVTTAIVDANVTCNGGSNGVATAWPSGGTLPYIYIWDNGESGSTSSSLSAGTHEVSVIDAINCVATATVTISEPPALFMNPLPFDATCSGNDGWVTFNVSGGTLPYEYSVDGGVTFTPNSTVQNLGPGVYQAFVVDANGCTTSSSFLINSPNPLTVNVGNVIDDFCNSCDGSATISVSGGTAPYTYQWSDGSTLPFPSNLCAGTYSVSVTDANGCTILATIVINNGTGNLTSNITINSNVSCSGIDDGSATVTASGGTSPITYYWSNGETSQTASNLEAGLHFVEVIDAAGCALTDTVTILDTGVEYTITTTATSCNTSDGTASIVFNTPVSNPSFMWSNGATTQTATGLAANWYSVTVENIDSGCRTKQLFEIEEDPSCFVTIEGYVYLDDVLPDCVQDAGTIPFSQKMLVLSNGVDSVYTLTDSSGYYSFEAEAGNYTVRLIELPFIDLACAGSYTNSVSAPVLQTTYQGGDFYLKYVPTLNVSTYYSSTPARPGFTHYMYVYYCNYGSDIMSGTFSLVHDPIMTNFNGNGLEDSYDLATRTVTWSYSNLAPGQCKQVIMNFLIPVGTPLGTQVCDTTYIEPLTGDVQPSNNVYANCRTVTGSFDPNDKQNLVGTDPFGGDFYEEDETFLYQVRFQNTGTDTAFTVVIRDTLDANLNVESLNVIDATHDYEVRFSDAHILEFWFENILLPDSNVNEPASNGFVLFTMDRALNIPLGTTIENSAAIYFDFNPPVITNTVVNTLALPPTSLWGPEVASLSIAAFPNPASEVVMLDVDLPESGITSASVYDYTGRLIAGDVVQAHFPQGKQLLEVPMNDLSDGVYFIRVQSGSSFGVVRVSVVH